MSSKRGPIIIGILWMVVHLKIIVLECIIGLLNFGEGIFYGGRYQPSCKLGFMTSRRYQPASHYF
jgi:hypothetical protein